MLPAIRKIARKDLLLKACTHSMSRSFYGDERGVRGLGGGLTEESVTCRQMAAQRLSYLVN